MNDPAFIFEENLTCLPRKEYHKPSFKVAVHKTAVFEPKTDRQIPRSQFRCPLHNAHHSLNTCVAFKDKSIEDRRKIVKDNDICFRCIDSKEHRGYKCPVTIQCNDCGSDRHSTGMHYDYNKYNVPTDSNHFDKPPVKHGGEHTEAVSTKCTQVCKDNAVGRSCAKIVLAKVFSGKDPNHHKLVYAILDDQSNRTLATPELLDEFNECDSKIINYKLSSCVGNVLTTGRQVDGLIIQSFDDLYTFDLPSVIECSDIPNSKDDIPSPDIVKHYAHLSELECFIPPIQDGCDISLLIGRDLPAVHHVTDQRIGSENSPFAQRLPMGWVIIGEVCVGEVHASTDIKVNKINILSNGRPTLLDPCKQSVTCTVEDSSIFDKTPDDDKVGLSHEDRTFLKLMDKQFEMNSQGQWSAPLPFKTLRSRLPNNKVQAEKRAKILDKNLHRDIVKRDHMMTFMTGILNKGHAEVAPPIQENEECWFLPLFGVYHPKKPDKIRGVFDSSASFHNISLNEVMVSGPDLTNNLIGVLLRFRQESIAVSADIEHMFYCFYVIPEHRRYLRFLWYKDNIFGNELIEYQMCVHVFGNRPSPSVANYGLRKAVENADPEVKNFVSKNFYVDDGLASFSSEAEASAVLNKSKETLWCNGNIRLHKFASNSKEFLTKFDSKDLAKDLIDMNLSDDLPMQNSLGLVWDLNCDKFVYKVSLQDKPSTRHGILSIINGLYDPLGFIAPVAVKGKVILRKLLRNNPDWDEQLSPDVLVEWNNWRNSLYALNDVSIPRCYVADGLSSLQEKQVLVYCDASESAIAAVAYIKGIDKSKKEHYGFILGKSKVAPLHCNTVPRLELCAALLATHIAKIISEELAIPLNEFTYFSDSRVVLGYINNEKRRFYVYVSNRVERIRQVSLPQQWNYIPTSLNPADQGTRFVNPTDLQESLWLHGPTAHAQESRKISEYSDSSENEIFPLIQPDGDKEVRTEVTTNKTQVQEQDCLGSYRFSKFSSLKRLICAIMVLRTFVKHFKNSRSKITSTINHKLDEYKNAEIFIFKTVQDEHFASEIKCRQNKKYVNKNSSIQDLNPYLDDKGLLRVGDRLNNSDMNTSQKNPIILPGKSHVAKLLVLQCHENTKHQGRHFTEGAVRDAGFWIIGGKKIIRSLLYKCVICKKLRGKLEVQRMADLPADRLIPGPPFSSVGVDTFGPWAVIARKTRGGVANAKRWVLIFTCLTTRAIHLEVIEEMSTSSFINALRRLISIRGNVNIFRSDRGSNFIGATDPLKIDVVNVEDQKVSNFLFNRGCKWLFNPPHASHMGGVWERMIGIVRKVLNGIMLEHGNREITHEVLVTFFAEVSAIVNSRPLVPVSCDSEQPFILSPNMLLTQKSGSSTSFDIGEFNTKDMFKAQWKRVQFLSDLFWTRWKGEFLCCLQQRQKWLETKPNIMENDIVLLREKDVHRNTWPMGIVVNALKSNDDIVRKVQVRVCKDGKTAVYTRPISELVVLVSEQ